MKTNKPENIFTKWIWQLAIINRFGAVTQMEMTQKRIKMTRNWYQRREGKCQATEESEELQLKNPKNTKKCSIYKIFYFSVIYCIHDWTVTIKNQSKLNAVLQLLVYWSVDKTFISLKSSWYRPPEIADWVTKRLNSSKVIQQNENIGIRFGKRCNTSFQRRATTDSVVPKKLPP